MLSPHSYYGLLDQGVSALCLCKVYHNEADFYQFYIYFRNSLRMITCHILTLLCRKVRLAT